VKQRLLPILLYRLHWITLHLRFWKSRAWRELQVRRKTAIPPSSFSLPSVTHCALHNLTKQIRRS